MSLPANKTRLAIPVHNELYRNFLAAFPTKKERDRATRRINNHLARMVIEKGFPLSDAVYAK